MKAAAQSFDESNSTGSEDDDQENENRVIEQALNDSEENKRKEASVFDLSPTLASGCAVWKTKDD